MSTESTAIAAPRPAAPSTRGQLPLRYLVLETRRQLRNVRAMVFTFAVPVVMLLVFGAAFGSQHDPTTGLQYVVVTTIQMAAYGAMTAALSQAFALVQERAVGWNRQLRITPLSGSAFLLSKVIAAMAFAAMSIAITIVVATVALHASLDPVRWLAAAAGIWLGVVPFALIAVLIGQFARPSFAQPLFMVVFMGLAILGGLWVPLSVMPHWMGSVAHLLPSYWLNRVGQMGAGASGQSGMAEPAMVLLAWAIVLGAVIVWRYRRDAARQ